MFMHGFVMLLLFVADGAITGDIISLGKYVSEFDWSIENVRLCSQQADI